MRTQRFRLATVVASVGLFAVACGGGTGTDDLAPQGAAPVLTSTSAAAAAPSPTTAETTAVSSSASSAAPAAPVTTTAAVPSQLPKVDVFDVATGKELDLATLAPAQEPILFWMWAPH